LRVTHARDDVCALHAAIEDASGATLVLLTGGTSAGARDLVPRALTEAGVSLLVQRVRQRPGRTFFAGGRGDQVFFGLPGPPLASHLCFQRYVATAARLLLGRPARPPLAEGRLLRGLSAPPDVTRFVPVAVRGEPCGWELDPRLSRSSRGIFAAVRAHGYLHLEPGAELGAGAVSWFEWMLGSGGAA
jgi:molybdopterin molybdotransferase